MAINTPLKRTCEEEFGWNYSTGNTPKKLADGTFAKPLGTTGEDV